MKNKCQFTNQLIICFDKMERMRNDFSEILLSFERLPHKYKNKFLISCCEVIDTHGTFHLRPQKTDCRTHHPPHPSRQSVSQLSSSSQSVSKCE